jgi:hypothetical protein
MPTITLSDGYDAKLKALVTEPFVDTRESLIQALIDEALARRGITVNAKGQARVAGDNLPRLNPDSPDNLAFTRVRSATVNGKEINRPKWNGVMDQLHVLALRRLGSFDALKRATRARLRQGRFEDEGYKYLPEADISIQGVDSNLAWAHSLRLARALRVPLRLTVEWRDTPSAAHPGESAVLEWSPPAD